MVWRETKYSGEWVKQPIPGGEVLQIPGCSPGQQKVRCNTETDHKRGLYHLRKVRSFSGCSNMLLCIFTPSLWQRHHNSQRLTENEQTDKDPEEGFCKEECFRSKRQYCTSSSYETWIWILDRHCFMRDMWWMLYKLNTGPGCGLSFDFNQTTMGSWQHVEPYKTPLGWIISTQTDFTLV